jgi:hypothetical protein
MVSSDVNTKLVEQARNRTAAAGQESEYRHGYLVNEGV